MWAAGSPVPARCTCLLFQVQCTLAVAASSLHPHARPSLRRKRALVSWASPSSRLAWCHRAGATIVHMGARDGVPMPQGVPESARGACVQAVPTAPTPASQPLAALAPAATPAAQPVAAATPAPPAVLATPSSAWQHVLSTNPLSVQAGPALCGQASLETSLNAHVTKTYSEQRLLKHLRSRLRLNKDCHRTSVPATALGTAARRRRARVQPTACRWGARWWAAPARSSSARSRTRPTPWQARATQRCARPSAPRPRPTRAAAPTPRRSSTGCARAVHRRRHMLSARRRAARPGCRRPPGAGQRSRRASARRERLQRRRTMGCTQSQPNPACVHAEVVQDTRP